MPLHLVPWAGSGPRHCPSQPLPWAVLVTSTWPYQAVHHTHNKTPILPGLESCNRLLWLNQGLLTDHLKNPPLEYSPQQETGYIAWKLWRATCYKEKNVMRSASPFSPSSHFPTPFLGLLFLPWLPGEFTKQRAMVQSVVWCGSEQRLWLKGM